MDSETQISRARWEGTVEAQIVETGRRLDHIRTDIERIESLLGAVREDIASIKVRVMLYGAVVGGVGTLIMLLVLAVATKAIG
jgi:hypothetical protein